MVQVAVSHVETRQVMESAVKTILISLAHCRFSTLYGSSSSTSIEDLGMALASLYAAIIIFLVKFKKFLDDNLRTPTGIYTQLTFHIGLCFLIVEMKGLWRLSTP